MYRFSRIWGTITAGLGWLILVGTPVVFAVGATTQSQCVAQLAQVWRGATTPWLLRIAVDSVNIQAAMLERLDEISAILAHRAETQSGRFRPLAGE